MRKLILLVSAAALLVIAGEGIYHASRGRQQVAVACNQFARERPASPRVLVTGCDINYAGAGYREAGGQVEELFLPARPVSDPSAPAPLVIATRDPTAVAIARGVFGGGRTATSEQSLEAMRNIVASLQMSTAIDGLARTGVVERLRSHRILSGLAPPIGEDAVVVDLHGRPDFLRPGVGLAAGTLLTWLALWPWRRRAPEVDVMTPIAGAAEAGEIQASQIDRDQPVDEFAEMPEGRPVRAEGMRGHAQVSLPRLLLLALDVSSGPEAIESAPPLGSRADVVAMLSGVIVDLTADHAGTVLTRPDGSVTVDLGSHDPVPTAVVMARGEAGVALLKEVLLMTGWRAFAPKTGLFVRAEDLEALQALAAPGPRA